MDPTKNILIFFLIIIALGNICFEISTVFYNALLKKVSDANNIGKIKAFKFIIENQHNQETKNKWNYYRNKGYKK